MNDEKRTVLEQLEDALLRVGPIGGGIIGGLLGAGILKDHAPAIVGFIGGGAVGGLIVGGLLYGVFLLVNPKRDRRKGS